MSIPEEFVGLIAKTYYEAALQKVNMRVVTESIEAIRSAFEEEKNCFEIWESIDLRIGETESEDIQKILMDFRNWFIQEVIAKNIVRLHEVFKVNREIGWDEWLRTFAESLSHFRITDFCVALNRENFPFPEYVMPTVENVRKWTNYACYERWPDAYEMYIYLAQNRVLSPAMQARMYALAAEIQLFHFLNPRACENLLSSAEKLSPNDKNVLNAWGEYWQQNFDFKKAQDFFRKTIEQDPSAVNGYIGIGDCYLMENELDNAQEWFYEAIKKKKGGADGYIRLLRFFGRSEMLETHEAQLLPLLKRAIAMDPRDEYDSYIDMGYVYQQNKRYQDAHDWYDQAIKLDNSRADGYIWKGRAYIDETNYPAARTEFEKAIELWPDSFAGYSWMARLFEAQQEWKEALHWHEKSMKFRPSWKCRILCSLGQINYNLQQYGDAQEDLINALRCEPENQTPLRTLLSIADDYYLKLNNPEGALGIYKRIRRIKGQSFEAEFQNRLGNLKYHNGDYVGSVKAYQNAISADMKIKAATKKPVQFVYHSNLGGAYRLLNEWDKAKEEFRKALELGYNEKDYEHALMLISNDEGVNFYTKADYQRAIDKYLEAIQFDPSDPVVHSNLADAYDSAKEWNKAREEYKNALDLGLKDEDYRHAMMLVSNDEGIDFSAKAEHQRAIDKYLEAIQFDPSDPVVHSNLAIAFCSLKQWDRANEAFKKALSLGLGEEDYRHGMMLVSNEEGNEYLNEGDYPMAIEKYKQAIEFESKDAVVYSNLALAWESCKEPGKSSEALDRAIEALQHAIERDPMNNDYKKRLEQLNQEKLSF
jgi:tetratricopeptide (TPR) repeat protein